MESNGYGLLFCDSVWEGWTNTLEFKGPHLDAGFMWLPASQQHSQSTLTWRRY